MPPSLVVGPMRIVAGFLKGREIPFQPRRFGDIRVTPGMVKGAVFSILGEDLAGSRFLDLCAGSGQMGLEACSRGAVAVMNEPDRRRREFIRSQVEALGLTEQVRVTDRPADRLVFALASAGERFDAVYVDPPYEARSGDVPLVEVLLRAIGMASLTAPGGVVVVQHGKRLSLPERAGCLGRRRKRSYGDTELSLYEADAERSKEAGPAGRESAAG